MPSSPPWPSAWLMPPAARTGWRTVSFASTDCPPPAFAGPRASHGHLPLCKRADARAGEAKENPPRAEARDGVLCSSVKQTFGVWLGPGAALHDLEACQFAAGGGEIRLDRQRCLIIAIGRFHIAALFLDDGAAVIGGVHVRGVQRHALGD